MYYNFRLEGDSILAFCDATHEEVCVIYFPDIDSAKFALELFVNYQSSMLPFKGFQVGDQFFVKGDGIRKWNLSQMRNDDGCFLQDHDGKWHNIDACSRESTSQ